LICTPKVRHFWRCIFFMGKTGRKNKRYSAEFKIGVIMDMREHRLGYGETVRKYWDITQGQEQNYKNTVIRWERIYLEEGAEGLMKERRGRACRASGTRKGRPPKLDKKVEEDLIAENQRLRMEIEYLKKLSALVLAEERENGKKQK
jgi:transposase